MKLPNSITGRNSGDRISKKLERFFDVQKLAENQKCRKTKKYTNFWEMLWTSLLGRNP